MAGPDPRRLVLIDCTRQSGAASSIGTGYLVAPDLVLTAAHVLPAAGVAAVRVRTEADGRWHEAEAAAAWRDDVLDAALLRLRTPLALPDTVALADAVPQDNQRWQSVGYPRAGLAADEAGTLWKTVGLAGTLYAGGGAGQGQRTLDLGVQDAPEPATWAGASGAPVFIDDQLVGLIREVPHDFRGGRLVGTPMASLLNEPGFRRLLPDPAAPQPAPNGLWVLVVLCERRNTNLAGWVQGILRQSRSLGEALGQAVHDKPVEVHIQDTVASPAAWLRFVRLLCAAPIAVFDATGFEPAVMLAMGVRAVVRRGITITSTADALNPQQASDLPFNIKETKLLNHGSVVAPGHRLHPLRALMAALRRGWLELRSQPRHYLDLPAYEGVRCPYPMRAAAEAGPVEQLLVLCPFAPRFEEANWLTVSNALVLRYPDRTAARMLDLDSPRLVGQALYEGIRWSRTCIADLTGWRPNVLFELGVRLACAELGPICLIDRADENPVGDGALRQHAALLALLCPSRYHRSPGQDKGLNAENDAVFAAAFDRHDDLVAGRPTATAADALAHDATYRVCLQAFDFSQDRTTDHPHQELRRTIEEPFGPDPQAAGRAPVLFSTNPEYSQALRLSVRERWMAAWYYLSNRHPRERWATDAALRTELLGLARQVLQFGPSKDDADPTLQAFRRQLTADWMHLRQLEAQAGPQPP